MSELRRMWFTEREAKALLDLVEAVDFLAETGALHHDRASGQERDLAKAIDAYHEAHDESRYE